MSEGLTRHMPRYHPLPDDWSGRGKVTITARPKWRECPLVNAVFPYHVGDRIRFHIHVERKTENLNYLNSCALYESFGGERKFISEINSTDTEVIGNIINRSGDVEYAVGLDLLYGSPDTIFTAEVESWDTIISKWGWALVGGFFVLVGVIAAWLLGIIEVPPHSTTACPIEKPGLIAGLFLAPLFVSDCLVHFRLWLRLDLEQGG